MGHARGVRRVVPGVLEGLVGGHLRRDVVADALGHAVGVGEQRAEVVVESLEDIAQPIQLGLGLAPAALGGHRRDLCIGIGQRDLHQRLLLDAVAVQDGEAKDPDAAYIEGPKGKLFAGFRSDIPNLKEKLALLPDPEPQVTDFLDSVKYRTPFALNESNGFRSCTIINLGKIALQLGRTLHFDPVKQDFINDEEASRMINPAMRAPWNM